jgi:hypothetical protein
MVDIMIREAVGVSMFSLSSVSKVHASNDISITKHVKNAAIQYKNVISNVIKKQMAFEMDITRLTNEIIQSAHRANTRHILVIK